MREIINPADLNMSTREMIYWWALGKPRGVLARMVEDVFAIDLQTASRHLANLRKHGSATRTRSARARLEYRYKAVDGMPPPGKGHGKLRTLVAAVPHKQRPKGFYFVSVPLEVAPLIRIPEASCSN